MDTTVAVIPVQWSPNARLTRISEAAALDLDFGDSSSDSLYED